MSDLPPIPHPELRMKARPGPLIVRFDWNGEHEPGALAVGIQQLFGPFQSVWIWANTIMGRDDNDNEHQLAEYVVSEPHGGGVWRAADDLYYTDVVFLYLNRQPDPSVDSDLAVQLLGSLVIEDVKKRVREATDG